MTPINKSSGPLRVALIGYGLAGTTFHAPFITTTPGLDLAWIVARSAERQELAKRDYPGAAIVRTPEELWALRDDIDLVVVATPNASHASLAHAAIDAGIAVLVDKPLANSAAEARRVIDAAARKGVLLTVYQNRRYDGDVQTLRRLLAEGTIGDPLRFESRFERWRLEPKPGWRESGATEDAGGLLVDLGSHLVDQALLLFGPAAYVYAELDRRRPGVEVDDDAFVAITHASGVRSHLWMSVMASQLGPRMRVLGTKGAYVKFGLDVQENALKAGERPDRAGWGEESESGWGVVGTDDAQRRVKTDPGSYGRLYRELESALRHDGPPPVDPRDSLRVLETIEAARQSALEGRVIRLADVKTS